MSTDRRDFLGTLLVAGLAGNTASRGGGGSGVPSAPSPAQGNTWNVSWVDRITGAHRVVFDNPEISAGLGLLRPLVWMKDYADVYAAKPADMTGVVVLRHNAIWMVMNDEFWDHHKIGELTQIKERNGRPVRRNPFLGPTPYADLPPVANEVLKTVLAAFTVLACNLAFDDVVEKVKGEAGGDQGKARDMALKHLVPGIILQPSGVFAVTRAEEAGCHYFLAS